MTLATALTAYRRTRNPALVSLIEALGEDATRDFTPPKERTNVRFHAAWLACCGDDAKRTWCLSTLTNQLYPPDDKPKTLCERLAALAKLPPDPRVAGAMVRLFELGPAVINFVVVDEAMQRVLRQHADASTLERAKAVGFEVGSLTLPPALELNQSERALLGAAPRRPQSSDGQPLYEAVYAAPFDDAPREVLADWLQEQGEPRGEFIALQFKEHRGLATDAEVARAQALARAHGKAWLGRLALVGARAEFRRGFPWKLELDGGAHKWEDVLNEPSLRTLEALAPGRTRLDAYAALLRSGAVPNLTALSATHVEVANVLSSLSLPRLERVDARRTRNELFRPGAMQAYARRLQDHVLPFVEATPSITGLGCDLASLRKCSKSLRDRLTTFLCDEEKAMDAWAELPRLTTLVTGSLEVRREGRGWAVRLLRDEPSSGLPKGTRRLEVVGNAALASRLQRELGQSVEVTSRPAPSGVVTGVKA